MSAATRELWRAVRIDDANDRIVAIRDWLDDWVETAHQMYETFGLDGPWSEELKEMHELRRETVLKALGEEVGRKCAVAWETRYLPDKDGRRDGFSLTLILPKRKHEMDL